MTSRRGEFLPARRMRLTDQVVGQLREKLAAGVFAPGDKLPPEPELMAQFGVGRTTIREAVRAIAQEGMLEVRQGDGTYVRSLTPGADRLAQRLARARVLEIYEVRRGLELEVCRLAAMRRQPEDLERMSGLLIQLREAIRQSDPARFVDADIDLHLALAASTKNDLLVELYQSFAEVLRSAIAEVVPLPGVMEACLSRHERLLQAVSRRDAEQACNIAAQYLERVAGALAATVARTSRPREAGGQQDGPPETFQFRHSPGAGG
jgi:GntR family transcriptional regulator, transcriptional repressor for pyruvate dehydrogenase complex